MEAVNISYETFLEDENFTTLASLPSNVTQADIDYYLSKVAVLDCIIAVNAESAQTQVERINQWLLSETEAIDKKKHHYIMLMENWMFKQSQATKKLVYGTLKIRKQQEEIVITDEEVVLKDIRFVRIVPEKKAIDRTALRQYLTKTGEIVDGVEVITRPDKFSYALSKEFAQ
jgi:hypothetical protein